PTAMAVLAVEPGRSYNLKCTLETYGYAKGEGEALESGTVTFAVTQAGESGADQASPPPEELDRLVELAERELRRVQAIVDRKGAPQSALDEVEMKLIDVRVRRARARNQSAQVESQLRRMIELRETDLKRIDALVKAKAVAISEFEEAERRLLEA